MTNLETLKKAALDGVLKCKTDQRSVLLSNPPQHRCDRRGCGNLWVVGDEPPMCKMFDYEKHTSFIIERVLDEVEKAMVPEPWPQEVGMEPKERAYRDGFNDSRRMTLEAFNTFRNGKEV